MAIKICADAYFLHNRTPLFFSLEMDGDKLVQRWISMCAGFKYSALKRLQLGEGDLEKWEKIGQKAEDSKFEKDVLVIDNIRRPTEDRIHREMERWSPSFAVVDTIDEIRAPSSCRSTYERGDHVARELKAICRSTGTPIIAIAQANREAAKDGASLDNIADSITIARKADMAVALHATPQMKQNHMCEITLLKNRDDGGENTKRTMYFNPGSMELRPWLPSDNVNKPPEKPKET
jgi:replicative DNA helicase